MTTPPGNLNEMTDAQREDVIAFYVRLPLAELRRRQRLNERTTERAWQGRKYRALRNVQVDAGLLTAAVDRREFRSE